MKKDPAKAQEAAAQLKEMIDSHNEFLSDELKSIALIERKKYLGLLKQMNVVLDSQARTYEAGLAQIKKCQEGIAKLLAPEEEENLPEALRQIIASGPSLVDKKTGDVEKLDGAVSFIKPYVAPSPDQNGSEKDREKDREKEREEGPRKDSVAPLPAASVISPAQPAAVPEPAKAEDSLDSYLNALNESASFFTPIKDSDDEDSETEESSDDSPSPPQQRQQSQSQPLPTGDSADGDPLRSLLKSFEGDRSVYVDKLN